MPQPKKVKLQPMSPGVQMIETTGSIKLITPMGKIEVRQYANGDVILDLKETADIHVAQNFDTFGKCIAVVVYSDEPYDV